MNEEGKSSLYFFLIHREKSGEQNAELKHLGVFGCTKKKAYSCAFRVIELLKT